MAGLHHSVRPKLSSYFSSHHFIYKLLLLVSFLPLSLALFAFFLQWRGIDLDPITRISFDQSQFSGMFGSDYTTWFNPSSSEKCSINVLGQSISPVFPYFRGWNFDLKDSDLKPKFLHIPNTTNSHALLSFKFRILSRIWNETWLSSFFYKPCNYELFVKQTLNMEMAIVMARHAGMDWIFHLDTDELLHPSGSREYSIRELLKEVPLDVDMLVFPNYESSIERDDIKEPFSEVSLFKKNYDHLPREAYFGHYKEATRNNPNYFLTYGNGKAAARIQDHLRSNGAHRWQNYMKAPKEIKTDEAAVLHYTYTKFSDLTSRRDRCGCKPTKDDVQKCFMLEFDRNAFIVASTGTQEEMNQWYREHVVWTDEKLKLKLLKTGILIRIYAPMVIIEGLRESGVFAAVLTSAQAARNSSENIGVVELLSRNIGHKSQPITRKILDIQEENYQSQAIPPLSPPAIHV